MPFFLIIDTFTDGLPSSDQLHGHRQETGQQEWRKSWREKKKKKKEKKEKNPRC